MEGKTKFPALTGSQWDRMMASLQTMTYESIEGVRARKFSAEDRKALAKKGFALPDGTYPVETVEDLKNAITLAQSGHGNVSGAKALIRKRAKALNYKLPDGF